MNHSQNENAECHIDIYVIIFTTGEQTLLNAYKSDGKKLSSAEAWNLQKIGKKLAIRNYEV